jgi:hypothetical protein
MPPENNMVIGAPALFVTVVTRSRERERVDDVCKGPLAYARSHEALSSDQRPLAYARSHTADGVFKGMLS